MKIRSGFVSNSSSSSFILNANKYNCVDIAKDMARTLYSDDDYTDYNEEYLKIIENLDKLENKNTAIFLNCCDDIRIVRVGDKLYVDASNHYDWELDATYGDENDEFYDNLSSGEYYFPEYDNKILGKLKRWDKKYNYEKIPYSCKCGSHSYIEVENDILMCPKCSCDPNGNKVQRVFREEKLERILKDDICK